MDLTVNGQTVYAHTGGRPFDPARPALVLIHGAGMDHTVWSLQSRYLAHHGRSVLAVDLPGHGRSGGAPLPSIEELAGWVAALLDAVGVAKAALAGHSMGALVALETAARHGDRIESLALLGVAETMPVHPDLLAAAALNDPSAIELVIGWGHGPRGHVGGAAAPGLSLLPGGRRLMQRARPGVLGVDLGACNAYVRGGAAAAAVSCPALFLLGGVDRMTPAKSGKALAAQVRHSKVIQLSGIGHMVMTEAPDATTDAFSTQFSTR
ncbi:alpha/beta hydrolase [Azospirillum brasilense]|uniref:Alpha/beta hydrolase n=1 Tax=Azospirillum brasilense TaxID=192 RepID=A0A0P0EDG4_AZOBR|nr:MULTISPECIES: alpha/beta hydrolase [Azospirillum]ALJ35769.1 alpha/beta hydrolase [Azospirillum brasilense]MDW7555041.1 alpha/beta hydrolase [Azospirillum brasilense]MDW7594818.1 alpha/beta hydrolase [Azospirillum brasilense]MDW7629672.1 alpha/beta hydrolase [Azospirillum brasilense]MDX5954532.1 alpha/beta hydrolase [Azospirillum brasilense]